MPRSLSLWRRVAWKHPEWWSFGLSLLAWMYLFAGVYRPGNGSTLLHLHRLSSAGSLTLLGKIGPVWRQAMVHWLLMVVAMMLPLVSDSIRNCAARNMWARRHRAIAGFILGYLGAWMIAGVLVCGATAGLQLWELPGSFTTAAALAVAATWQFSSIKRRSLQSCHRTVPLAPHGWRADFDCFRYGGTICTACIVSCWPLMAACMLAEHSLVVMVFAGAIGFVERYIARTKPHLLGVAIAAVALMIAVKVPF